MITSMTGYGKIMTGSDACDIKIEMKSVNNKYTDVNVRLPKLFNHLELPIRSIAAEKLVRGKIDVFVEVRQKTAQFIPRLNAEVVDGYVGVLEDLKKRSGATGDVTLSHLLHFSDIMSFEEDAGFIEDAGALVMSAVVECADTLVAMRTNEGTALEKDVMSRIDTLESLVNEVDASRDDVRQYWIDRFKKRMEDFEVVTDYEERIVQEAAMHADKADISEEITRIRSHVAQFRNVSANEYPCGKKLDFIGQELNREFNTIGSKTGKVDIINRVVIAKSEIDKVREQVLNIV